MSLSVSVICNLCRNSGHGCVESERHNVTMMKHGTVYTTNIQYNVQRPCCASVMRKTLDMWFAPSYILSDFIIRITSILSLFTDLFCTLYLCLWYCIVMFTNIGKLSHDIYYDGVLG